MSESPSVSDLRLLDEIAIEIEKHKYGDLFGALERAIKTQRAKHVAKLLKSLAVTLMDEKYWHKFNKDKFEKEINALRDENQQLTNLVELLENQINK